MKFGDGLLIYMTFIMVSILWILAGLGWFIPVSTFMVAWFFNWLQTYFKKRKAKEILEMLEELE